MPPPRGTANPIEGPGDYTVTTTVHNSTYAAIDPIQRDLSDRAVFITGASRGVGLATAISFAKAGASYIAIGARSGLSDCASAVKQAAKEAGRPEPKVLELKLDVTAAKSVSEAVGEIERVCGRLDIVVNNAGALLMASIIDSDPDEWWRIWEVNVKGPFLVSRAALPLLLKSERGLKQVLTVSSVGAHLKTPTLSAYQPSKLAVFRFTEFIATEYGSQGVIAITIHPGNMPTDMAGDLGDLPPELQAIFTESTDLPADTIVWLTAERREWLSGRYVNATWDMVELERKSESIVKDDRLRVKLDVDF